MKIGTSFLKSKLARRFCLLFILCAFLPTVILVFISYHRVESQLEEQSLIRLKRETKAYSLGLFDRMIRLHNELETMGEKLLAANNTLISLPQEFQEQLQELFAGIIRITPDDLTKSMPQSIWGSLDTVALRQVVDTNHMEEKKPFIVALPQEQGPAVIYMGLNIHKNGRYLFTIIGETDIGYLWGVGASPLLPPATELTVYNARGQNIMSSGHSPGKNYRDIDREFIVNNDLQLFTYTVDGKKFYANFSNVFIESRFQPTGWTIALSQAREDIMDSLAEFKATFPFIVLFFLLLILYLSFNFIRKGLEPLEALKAGTKRIALKDFSHPVTINSRDEFEELGQAFNSMGLQLQKQFNTLATLREIDRSILSSVNKVEIVITTLQHLKMFFHADATIYLKSSDVASNRVKYYLTKGRRKNDPAIRFTEISDHDRKILFEIQKAHITFDGNENPPRIVQEITSDSFSTILAFPINVGNTIKRMTLLCWKENRIITEDELNQAQQVANQLAVGLTNAYLLEDLEKLAIGTIEALARTVDAKSQWTSGHSERVSELSGKIANVLGFSIQEIDALTRGALLHDIGKIGIPISILDKPGRLTDAEYAEVKRHPEIGGQILEPIEAYKDLLPVVIQHHEKFDGTGYPDGLKGDEIDLRARILAVADVWDAVVSNRPYREGWVTERARKMIIENSGTHFDPKVVDAFLTVLER